MKEFDPNDIIGNKYGMLTVVRYDGYRAQHNSKYHFYECVCDCGKSSIVCRNSLLSRLIKTCGCKGKYKRLNEIIGKQYNNLVVLGGSYTGKENALRVKCKCLKCGNVFECDFSNVKRGHTKQCKCLKPHSHGYYTLFFNRRENIRAFFNFKCVLCGAIRNPSGRNLSCHHIYGNQLEEFETNKFKYALLCDSCHTKLHGSKSFKKLNLKLEKLIDRKYNGQSFYDDETWKTLHDWIYITV